MSIEFEKIVTDVLEPQLKELRSKKYPGVCLDKYAGKISDIAKEKRRDPVDKRGTEKCLILILESPHVDEFKDRYNPAPAMGRTGEKIAAYIKQVKDLDKYQENYGLILMNAIQYQCSLGEPTQYFRDQIFRAAWENDDLGKKNFQDRLLKVFNPGDVIVNCCTKGNKKPYLRDLVQDAIEEMQEQCKFSEIFGRTHPSYWHMPKNQEFDWLNSRRVKNVIS